MRKLHDVELSHPVWWACSEPERPADPSIAYDSDCPRCVAKMRVEVKRNPDTTLLQHNEHGDATQWTSAAEILRRIQAQSDL